MRQVLFRINLDEPFSFAPIAGVTGVGAGYLLIGLVIFFAALSWWERNRAAKRPKQESPPASSALGSWGVILVVAAAVLSGPAWADRVLPNGVPVFGYGAMVFLGFVFGAATAMRLARRAGIDPEIIWDLLTWVFIAGIGGARLFYLVQKRRTVFYDVDSPSEFFIKVINLTDGGLVLLGGVLAVVAAIILYSHRRGIPPLRMGDVIVPAFFVGLGFGRIGCLMNGCCFGDRCELPWAIQFPQESAAWLALMNRGFISPDAVTTYGLHPTQVYSSIAAFLLAAVTATYFRLRPFDGAVLVVGMLLYASKRFVIEFLRGDELGQLGTIFTISQLISAGIFVGGLVLLAWLVWKPAGRIPDGQLAAATGSAPAGRG